jgi:hypothetical protein
MNNDDAATQQRLREATDKVRELLEMPDPDEVLAELGSHLTLDPVWVAFAAILMLKAIQGNVGDVLFGDDDDECDHDELCDECSAAAQQIDPEIRRRALGEDGQA